MIVLHFVYDICIWFFEDDLSFKEQRKYPTGNPDLDTDTRGIILDPQFEHDKSSLMGNFGILDDRFDEDTNQLHIWAKASSDNLDYELARELYYMDPDRGNDLTMFDTYIDDHIMVIPRIVKVYIDDVEVNISELPSYE